MNDRAFGITKGTTVTLPILGMRCGSGSDVEDTVPPIHAPNIQSEKTDEVVAMAAAVMAVLLKKRPPLTRRENILLALELALQSV